MIFFHLSPSFIKIMFPSFFEISNFSKETFCIFFKRFDRKRSISCVGLNTDNESVSTQKSNWVVEETKSFPFASALPLIFFHIQLEFFHFQILAISARKMTLFFSNPCFLNNENVNISLTSCLKFCHITYSSLV